MNPTTIKTIMVAAIFLAAFSLPTIAQPDARALLDDFAQELDSLSAEFSQITVDGRDEVVEESYGRMYFQAPDLIRWDYLEPFPQVIVADGEQLWHYDESLEQVTVRPQPAPGDSPMLVLTRPELLEKFYRILPSDRPDQLRFEPLADQAEIEMARLTFRDGKPATLDLFDPFGQSTRLTLTDIERNPQIDPSVFEFEVPEGADVLEGL
ncbi:MAG TPA: outer membrane lipoprotein chaperone LolA [Wenzhouxiangellaceae bacterium]|nr:outer membrane lipoprotein chaperone LolA [Wenzhouxiangellaceae bacterium]